MLDLIKPKMLKPGDKVAAVSLSWGGAGDDEILWRYRQGKERLENIFGLKVVEMPNTLKGTEYVYNHPEKRAEDLMNAFSDKSIKGIISCIGGDDSIRMLPYINFDTIRQNPKIFMGYSDSTITNFICLKAGISSIYGPAILVDFAENVQMSDYTIESVKKTLFSNKIIGNIAPSKGWTSERLEWIIENKNISRKYMPNEGYELLQGDKKVRGRLIGGCLAVIEFMKETVLFPEIDVFNNAILFLETSEEMEPKWYVECCLRNYGTIGILDRISGIIFGKPYNNKYYDDYKTIIKKVLKEYNREDMPVLYNMNFGHTEPKICLPYGALTEIDCEKATFSILENAVD